MRIGVTLAVLWILIPLGDRIGVSQTNVSFNGYSLVDKTGAIQNPIVFSNRTNLSVLYGPLIRKREIKCVRPSPRLVRPARLLRLESLPMERY
jgi:hypothetical protein